MSPCPACGCDAGNGAAVHALAAALRAGDIDRALELGLVDASGTCAGCSDACRAMLDAARLERQRALAARERFRARAARLERRQRERDQRRQPATTATGTQASNTPALPPAAAAALARAKARAAERGRR
jgi:hypothetical protein